MGDRLQQAYNLGILTNHPGKLSLLPSAGQEMSTGQRVVVMLCGWGVKQV